MMSQEVIPLLMSRSHRFSWQPGDGARHATADERPDRGRPVGTRISTLCGTQVLSDESVEAWLWVTCPRCNIEAHELAGIPMPGAADEPR